MHKFRFLAAALLSLNVVAALSAAQGPPPPGPGQPAGQQGQLPGPWQPRPIEVEKLTPDGDVYWVKHVGFGAFIVGDKGVIVVDTGGSPATGRKILDEVAKVTSKPVSTLILTHCDGDHVNGISAFPAGIEIIAQENNKKFLEAELASGETGPESIQVPADRLPNHVVGDREVVQIDGVKMQLFHWAPAHTSGDLVVYLPEEKLVLVGDVMVMDQHNLPLIHLKEGGTSKGWIESVQGMLTLDASKYVVGHEGVVGKDVLEEQLRTTITERQKVKELFDKGVSLTDIQAAVGDPVPAASTGNGPKRGPNFPPFSEVVYRELKAGTY